MTKLDFRLVPTKGVTSGKGYRAEWVRGLQDTLDFDEVIAEAQANGAFAGLTPSRVRADLEAFLDTLVGNVLSDGKTRKLDGYIELALRIHGKFDERTDDFDAEKHSLDLVATPLRELRQKPKTIQPVNVNRIRQFRISYITAADGLHKNHQVVLGQEFVIRGSNLTLPETEMSGVHCMAHIGNGQYLCAEAPILEKSDTEIRCAWPTEFGPELTGRTLYASVDKVFNIEADPPDIGRTTHAGIYSE